MKLRLWVTLGAALVGFSSCDAFFTTNLFKEAGMGQESAADIASKSSADLAKDAASSGPDSTFYQVLTEDPATKAAVLATLANTYTSSPDPAAVQAAAAAAAKIELVTTGADELVNGLVSVLADPPDFATMDASSVASLVQDLIPSGLLASEAGFAAALQALIGPEADAAYAALESSVTASDGQISASVLGSAAQGALLASVIDAIDMSAPTVLDPDGLSYAAGPAGLAALLWDLATTPSFVPTGLDINPSYNPTADAGLNKLLIAGGLDLAALGF